MRSRGTWVLLVLAAAACEDTPVGSSAERLEVEDIAGFYVLAAVGERAPPVTGYPGCVDFVERSVSLCAIETARLHLGVTNTFRLVLVARGTSDVLTVIKGAYDVVGRTMTYTSGPDGEFAGRVLLEADCATAGFGNGLTFERGPVVLRFCRDPASRPTARDGR